MNKRLIVIAVILLLAISFVYAAELETGLSCADVLLIKIPTSAEFIEYEIDFDGYVNLEQAGSILAEDLTIAQLERAISKALPRYISDLGKTKVQIKEKRIFVQVIGHVNLPGWYSITDNGGVPEALKVAGGITDGAVISDIKIFRETTSGTDSISVDLYKFKVSGNESDLPKMQNKDVLIVPITIRVGNVQRKLHSWNPDKEELEITVDDKVRIIGEVNSPSMLEPVKNSNILDMIIAAGGPTINADFTEVVVVSKSSTGEYSTKSYNLQKYIESKRFEHIPIVYAGDTIYVQKLKPNFHTKYWVPAINILRDLVFLASLAVLVMGV